MLLSKVNLISVHNFLIMHNYTDFLKYFSKNLKIFGELGYLGASEPQVACPWLTLSYFSPKISFTLTYTV